MNNILFNNPHNNRELGYYFASINYPLDRHEIWSDLCVIVPCNVQKVAIAFEFRTYLK